MDTTGTTSPAPSAGQLTIIVLVIIVLVIANLTYFLRNTRAHEERERRWYSSQSPAANVYSNDAARLDVTRTMAETPLQVEGMPEEVLASRKAYLRRDVLAAIERMEEGRFYRRTEIRREFARVKEVGRQMREKRLAEERSVEMGKMGHASPTMSATASDTDCSHGLGLKRATLRVTNFSALEREELERMSTTETGRAITPESAMLAGEPARQRIFAVETEDRRGLAVRYDWG